MFQVDEIQFGRISWYYQEVAGDPAPAEMGRTRFTPMDLGARWIMRNNAWDRGASVIALAGGDAEFDRHLALSGYKAVGIHSVGDRYVAGAYLLAEAEAVCELLESGGLDALPRLIFPFGRVLLAMQLPFAGNHGFDHACDRAAEESRWLRLSAAAFEAAIPSLPRELALESPALLARLVCRRLRVAAEPAFAPCAIDRFIFDPDVMTTPMGWAVDSQTAAQRLTRDGGECADRRGVLLLRLARTARL